MSPASKTSTQPFLVRFYDPNIAASDHQGRTLSTILTWNDRKLESCHDYIQIIFPLPEGSAFGWSAPVIDKPTFEAFRARSELRASLKDSFIRILSFYGLELQEDGDKPKVVRGPHFNVSARNWVTKFNHNHLRITRIIRSLRVLGLEAEAIAFYHALKDVYEQCRGRIGQRSMMYWTRAISRPLHVAPDAESDEESDGEDFLYQYDKKSAEAKEGLTTMGANGQEVTKNNEEATPGSSGQNVAKRDQEAPTGANESTSSIL